ncbi:outer membrane biogenesis protein BamB [Pseudobythopirellula maris]|uniref:Outer membrane biogenesis protein BamB n=1 Tax=Pseudobythopirellula maris TaxID=2527991 RepID=A0A5C5ZNC5_9BACT|nr:PQQ-binding-like beta-propeller repeat protein [Pseudobythopirellula maris]TWT88616.1 outer membrane biogenesis protein BamB [Pseudobythopirellula maris]
MTHSQHGVASTFCSAILVAATALVALPSPARAADPMDWPLWRGPHGNGVSDEVGLVDEWDPKGGEGSNLLWKSDELGGRSTPIVMNGKLYTLTRDQPGTELEGEKVVCADAATGKVLWEYRFNVYLSDVPDTRVGWSSVVGDPATGRVYAQGVCGYFCCLEGDSGEVVWDRSLHEEFGLLSTYGGRTNFPLIHDDTVIISAVVIGWGDTPQWGLMAKPAHRFMAFDKATGEMRWLSGTRLIPYDTTYSSPTPAVLNGQRALVFGSGDGAVWAMQAGTGKTLWNYPISRRGLNVSPLVTPNGMVYTGHSEENIVGTTMGAFVAIDGTKQGALELGDEEWIVPQAMVGKSSPIAVGGRIYAMDDRAKLFVYDAKTGERITRKALGRAMRGSPIYADGKIYTCTNEGMFYILKPTDDGVEVLQKLRLRGEEVNASPIVSHGRIYMTTADNLYCIGDPSVEPSLDIRLVNGVRPVPTASGEPAQMQVVPWDTLLAPGEEQTYTVRLYNATGEFLREASSGEVSFSVDGPGSVTPDGRYIAPTNAPHKAALVNVAMGDLKGQGRVRIVPPLPWSFDFNDGELAPLTWVGGRIRYVPRDENGEGYLAKPTELPTRPGAPTTKLGTRSQMWMGPSDLADYTVQADVQMQTGVAGESSAASPDAMPEFVDPSASDNPIKLPSAGLINSGYTFTLFGPNSEARLYSWCTHPERAQASVAMEFEPHVWYTMKCRVEPADDGASAKVYGKVWKRDEQEPAEWTLEFVDEAPNLQGAPGLFGDSKEAEFYVDNLKVTPND